MHAEPHSGLPAQPLQNRVTPFGEIVRAAARGTLMGNRGGCLHDEHRQLKSARWRGRRWIACLLDFKGRRRVVMAPGRYTELFFLDEATALAAGHRPCAECRRADFNAFKTAWLRANGEIGFRAPGGIDAIDRQLHHERLDSDHRKRTYTAELETLPNGVLVTRPEELGQAYLIWDGKLYRWSFQGYGDPYTPSTSRPVEVLTPRSTVRALAAGYMPQIHASFTQPRRSMLPWSLIASSHENALDGGFP